MPGISSFISSCPVMDRQSENHRDIMKFLLQEIMKSSSKLLLELHEQRKALYTYTERMHCLLEMAKETICFEDNLFSEAENPCSHMAGISKAPLCTGSVGYHSTPQKWSTIFVPSNMNGFCYFNTKNQRNTTENKFLEGINEPYDTNTLHTTITLNTSQLQDKFTGSDLNSNSELLSHEKRKKTVHGVSSFVMASTVFLWIAMEICSQLSIIQPQPKSSHILFLSTFLKLFGFMAFVSAIAAMIVIGAPFSTMQSFMLMFWAIFMLVTSAKSLTEVYLPLLGIIFTGCYVLVPSSHHHTYMKVNNEKI